MTPQTEDDVAQMVRDAQGPLRVRGGDTRGVMSEGDTLSTAGLSGMTLYEPGALTLVVRAGTPMTDVEAALAAENQRLAFEPLDHRVLLGTTGTPTIGGAVAVNAAGPRRIQVGACRDHLLGVRFVDGGGQIIKNGGRVMKNVTGYDLVKLLAGSHGTLGVLTEVSLKVLPQPERTATLTAHVADAGAAVALMSQALGSAFDVTGAAALQEDGGFRVFVRLEGFDASVRYRAGRLRDALRLDDGDDPWAELRDVAVLRHHAGVVRVSVRPSQAPQVLARLDDDVAVQMDWGGGLIWLGGDDATALLRAAQAVCADLGGHATGIKGDFASPRFQPEPAAVAAISAGLRAKFDPRGILNPGVMG
ncbi:FAD-binding protein [Loktanella sp. SALINAS62]|uniref:FAD-binding protein n=1 Tax=Loktanella sp. SALINAS62 TaxID=2706124 RepID=UPI001B8B5AD5|nr:FAD-binding protein [Loktanella sp. SALINAS62]MBS1301089.1 FAD-binding protein [Loktanella sp. SALINAS62]